MHAWLGIAGLLLGVGVALAALLDLHGEAVEAAGTLVAIPFALALFSAVPFSAGAVLLCRDGVLVAQSLAHLLFIAVLLLLGEASVLVTTLTFAGYVAIVLYGCWRRRHRAEHRPGASPQR